MLVKNSAHGPGHDAETWEHPPKAAGSLLQVGSAQLLGELQRALCADAVSLHIQEGGSALSLAAATGLSPEEEGALRHVQPGPTARETDVSEGLWPALDGWRAQCGFSDVIPVQLRGQAGIAEFVAFFFREPLPQRPQLVQRAADFVGELVGATPAGPLARRSLAADPYLRALTRASRVMASAGLTAPEVRQVIVQEASRLLHSTAVIHEPAPGGSGRVVTATAAPNEERAAQAATLLEGAVYPLGAPWLEGPIARGEAVLVSPHDVLSCTTGDPSRDAHGPVQTLVAPLAANGLALGVLTLVRAANDVAFTPQDVMFVESFADLAGLALENAQAFERAEQARRRAERTQFWLAEREQVSSEMALATCAPEVIDATLAATDFLEPVVALLGATTGASIKVLGARQQAAPAGTSRHPGLGTAWAELLTSGGGTTPTFLASAEAIQHRLGSAARCPPRVQALAVVPLDASIDMPAHSLLLAFARPVAFSRGIQTYLTFLAQRAAGFLWRFHALERLQEKEARAKRLAEFQAQLLSIVGHDLRNPLAGIRMAATLLSRMPPEPERQASVLRRIVSSTERCDTLIGEFLDYTRARIGNGIPITPRPLCLLQLTEDIVSECRDAVPGREVNVDASGDVRGAWDPGRLGQVLSNLVRNALTYGDPAQPIEVAVVGDAHSVVISVKNQGVPIPREKLATIFTPYERGSAAGDARSVGLGLYIVRKITEGHGGSVRVRSNADVGTEFEVRLPKHPQAPAYPVAAGAARPCAMPADVVRTLPAQTAPHSPRSR